MRDSYVMINRLDLYATTQMAFPVKKPTNLVHSRKTRGCAMLRGESGAGGGLVTLVPVIPWTQKPSHFLKHQETQRMG